MTFTQISWWISFSFFYCVFVLLVLFSFPLYHQRSCCFFFSWVQSTTSPTHWRLLISLRPYIMGERNRNLIISFTTKIEMFGIVWFNSTGEGTKLCLLDWQLWEQTNEVTVTEEKVLGNEESNQVINNQDFHRFPNQDWRWKKKGGGIIQKFTSAKRS